jgi:hypothetical protein
LQISRGLIYSIQAQDLLDGIHAFSPAEQERIDTFHRAMYDWIRATRNTEVDRSLKSRYPDETFNNQTANHLVALLAAARLLDDKKRFLAALYGGDPSIPLRLPWTELFNYVIYGVSDTPLPAVTPNSSKDPLRSNPAYSTKDVAPGEINDRYRNDTPLQGMGYPVFTLEHLFAAAEILRIAGFDAYAYRGFRQQSIEMATQYYACYARYPGLMQTVSDDNAKACPGYAQYIGKVVNDVDKPILIGALRFPDNRSITDVEVLAKAETTREDALDAIGFGKWRD